MPIKLNPSGDSFTIIDVVERGSGTEVEEHTLSVSDIVSWTSTRTEDDRKRTRILFWRRLPSELIRLMLPPMPDDIYNNIATLWHIPPLFRELYCQFLPIGVSPVTVQSPEGSLEAYFMKSQYNWPWEFAVMVLRNTTSGSINAICFGLKDAADETRSILSQLRSSADQAFNIFWLPVTLLSLTCAEMSLECGRIADSLWLVQNRTGLHGSAYGRDLKISEGGHILIKQDIVDLTAILDRCARFRAKTDTMKRLLDLVDRSNEQGRDENLGFKMWVSEALERSRQTVLGSQEHLQWFQQSASSQLQTIYQLTNQQDSQQAQADGKNMLTIAIMTMIFLPGGFTAAFFSMSIFQFQPQDGPQVVSSWIWVYVVVTIALMAVVFGAWGYFTYYRGRYYTGLLRDGAPGGG